jgi:hypothetical protein
MVRFLGPLQEAGPDHGLERSRDLWEVISDIRGQTIGHEEGPRMTMEEQ